MYGDKRVKIKDFFKRNKSKIIIIFLIWLVIFIINKILENYQAPIIPLTTYEPHTAIMDNSTVPKKQQEPIENLIAEYIGYCNNKDYEKAYNMLSSDCKNEIYPNIEEFKKYVDSIFTEKKAYAIQDYSNVDDTYIYKVDIFEDILATGLTGKEDFTFYSEKFVIKNDNGKLSLSIREYIGTNKDYHVYEDEYIKVEIQEMTQSYEFQTYKVTLTNRTEYPIVLADGTEQQEIMLELEDENRSVQQIDNRGIYLNPYESKEVEMKFVKFYDEDENAKSIIFDAVRVLKSYSGIISERQEEINNAIKLYSFSVGL